jgi:hypothetical protein
MDSRRATLVTALLIMLAQQALALQGYVANQNSGITDPPPAANQRTVPNRPHAGSPILKSPPTP